MPEDDAFPPVFQMEDVTARIAYAYAKAEVVYAVGLGSVLASAIALGLLADGRASGLPLGLGGAALGLVVGAVLVYSSWGAKDLKGASVLQKWALVVLGVGEVGFSLLAGYGPSSLRAVEVAPFLAALGTLALGVRISFPFPTRKGGTVLYSPAAIRSLSDGRGWGALSLAVVLGGVAGLLSGARGFGGLTTLGPLLWLGLIALGVASALLFLLRPPPTGLLQARALPAMYAVVAIWAVAVAAHSGELEQFLVAGFLVGFSLSGLETHLIASPHLNTGRTVIDRRA